MSGIKKWDKQQWLTLSLIFLGVVTLLSSLILINLGRYSALALDDYDYGMDLYHLIQTSSYSWVDVLKTALNKVIAMRSQWQGTYFGIFVMALNPLVFNSNLGWVIPFVSILSIFLGNVCLFCWIGRKLKLDWKISWIAIFAVTLVNINTLPSMNEGMYWWISVSFYTLSYFLAMGYFVLWMDLPKHRIIYSGLMLVVGFMLEGNCWPVCTLMIAFTVLYCFELFLHRRLTKKDRWLYALHFLFLAGCFVFALSAPGNFVRESQVAGVPAWLAVIESPFYAIMHLLVYLTPATVVVCCTAGYLLHKHRELWKMVKPQSGSFWFLLAVILIYSAMFAPTIYGENHVAAGRYLNMLYLLHLPICLLITWFFVARYGSKIHIRFDRSFIGVGVVCGFVLLFSGLFNGHYEDFSSLTALLDLRNGYAIQYQAETKAREAILLSDEKVVTIPKRTVYPRLFMVDDGTTDWVNEDMCEFYGKQEIIISNE